MTATWQILEGDARARLADLADGSVHTVVTSPPYFGLRDYGTGEWEGGDPACEHRGSPRQSGSSTLAGNGHGGGKPLSPYLQAQTSPMGSVCTRCGATRADRQIGLEATPDEFVAALVGVFREVRRVLRDDGTAWLNLGDSFATRWASRRDDGGRAGFGPGEDRARHHAAPAGFKSKDLIGIPWMVAFALRADGWYLRADVVWAKPNPMPESVTDRPTRSHEFIFLLSKSPSYFYDAEAIREPDRGVAAGNGFAGRQDHRLSGGLAVGGTKERWTPGGGRNKRDVWTVTTKPYKGAHFATFPPDLIEPCVLAGAPERACAACGAPWERVVERGESSWAERKAAGATWGNVENADSGGGTQRVVHGEGVSHDLYRAPARTVGFEPSCGCDAGVVPGVVLDPFSGAGTTGLVALRRGRSFVGLELNPAYAEMARERIRDDAPMFNIPAEVSV